MSSEKISEDRRHQVWSGYTQLPGGASPCPCGLDVRASAMVSDQPWPWLRQKGKPREAQLGEGSEVFAAFTFTPSVLCDLGKYLYSLNKLGSGSLLANALHMYVARNNEDRFHNCILSLRDKQFKLFVREWPGPTPLVSPGNPLQSWHGSSEANKA